MHQTLFRSKHNTTEDTEELSPLSTNIKKVKLKIPRRGTQIQETINQYL
jgi:hypothetical protein